ncbi:MAG: Mov34/MPN/PAD-1 family protein [Promethearchaeota archaeon]
MKIDEDFVFPVYIYEDTLNDMRDLCKKNENEIFGYLIGLICRWNNNFYIIIEEKLFIEGTFYSHKLSTSQIEGTAGKYEREFQKLKKNKNMKNLRVVGWWHSHPDLGCFLSFTDLHTQKVFFPESYQVALVIDPVKVDYEFFTLDKNTKKKYIIVNHAVISRT